MSERSPKETVSRLKELLFAQEARELDTLNRRLADIHVRAGSDTQFQKAVARVLDRAVRDAEASRHKELSDALAPMVLRSLRTEMRSAEMQDQIAGAMYPRVGEMVKRYVASAIRDMMQEINRRLETGLSHNRAFLWLRSVASGRSMAELALADTQQLEVQEIYLVRRGSGVLVHHWRRPGVETDVNGDNRDTLVSGFLAAITALAEEAFEADQESLRTLDLDNHRIYLRGSPDYLLAAKCIGSAPAGIDRVLDTELIRVLDENQTIGRDGSLDGSDTATIASRNALLADFADRVERAARDRTAEASHAHGMRTLKVLLWLIGLPLAALIGWYLYVGFATQSLQSRADQALAAIPKLKGYPVKAHVERGGRQIWVGGLAPDDATRREVLGAMKNIAPAARLSEAIGVLPNPDVQARLAAEGFRRAVEHAERKLASLLTDLARLRVRFRGEPDETALAETETATRAALEALRKPEPDGRRDGPDAALPRAYDGLAEAAAKLAKIVGSERSPAGPAPQDAADAADALALAADRIGSLIASLEQRQAVEPIERRVDELGASAEERIAALDDRYRKRLEELERRLAAQQPSPATPRQRLAAFARANAIFFGNEAQYRDDAAARAMLDELAGYMRGNDLVLRVIGYTDETGTAARNSPLSQARAEKVVADLVARGIEPSRLIAIGRLNGVPIAPGSGIQSSNRRAEFELAFEGERGGQP